jgi:hypothetical protein
MASAQSSNHMVSNYALKLFDFDPDATTATDVGGASGWVDLATFSHFLVCLFRSVGTGTVSSFIIQASASSDGSSPVTVKAHAIGTAPDAVGDQIFLECSAEEIAVLGTHLRYVNAKIALATSTDECVVAYLRKAGRHAYNGLTADAIS